MVVTSTPPDVYTFIPLLTSTLWSLFLMHQLNQEINTLKRILTHSESSFYALYQAYTYVLNSKVKGHHGCKLLSRSQSIG